VPILHIAVLAIVQGVTEFLPISSQAHLRLVSAVTGWADQGLMMDVAVHVGTLGAVMLYFWRDIGAMTVGLLRLMRGREDPGARLAGLLIVATIPALAAGFLLSRYYPGGLRGLELIAWTTLVFGILLYIGDKMGMTVRRIEHLRFGDVVIIGIAQVLALIPGTSRSGITITAARFLGLERRDGARFSMLLSMEIVSIRRCPIDRDGNPGRRICLHRRPGRHGRPDGLAQTLDLYPVRDLQNLPRRLSAGRGLRLVVMSPALNQRTDGLQGV